jgi:hypothetical protein
MTNTKTLLLFSGLFILFSCSSNKKYKQDLFSDNVAKICKACYELGEAKDTSAIKPLLTRILDPRISHDIRFKGMSVAECRLGTLKKISNIDALKKDNTYIPDTAAAKFYLNWAVQKGYLKDKNDVDIYYFK